MSRVEDVEHVVVIVGDRLGGRQIELSGEHRQRREHALLVVVEQLVRPPDRVLQGAMARVGAPPDPLQETESFVEPAGDLGDVDRPRP